MSPLDRLAVACLGVLLIAAISMGWRASVRPAPGPAAKGSGPHGIDIQAGVALRQGVDPLRPPGLPEGARIDVETGLLLDVDLKPRGEEQALPWTALTGANDAQTEADLPASVRALHGKRVVLAGFLMPLYALRNIREFALVGSHYTCCFAKPPGLGDQMIVKLARGAAAQELTVKPLRISGIFRIVPQHLYGSGKGPLIALFEIVDARATLFE